MSVEVLTTEEIIRKYDFAWDDFKEQVRGEPRIIILGVTGSFAGGTPRLGLYGQEIDPIEIFYVQVKSRMIHRGELNETHEHPSDIDVVVRFDVGPSDFYEVRDRLNAVQRKVYEEHRVFIHWTDREVPINELIGTDEFRPSIQLVQTGYTVL